MWWRATIWRVVPSTSLPREVWWVSGQPQLPKKQKTTHLFQNIGLLTSYRRGWYHNRNMKAFFFYILIKHSSWCFIRYTFLFCVDLISISASVPLIYNLVYYALLSFLCTWFFPFLISPSCGTPDARFLQQLVAAWLLCYIGWGALWPSFPRGLCDGANISESGGSDGTRGI